VSEEFESCGVGWTVREDGDGCLEEGEIGGSANINGLKVQQRSIRQREYCGGLWAGGGRGWWCSATQSYCTDSRPALMRLANDSAITRRHFVNVGSAKQFEGFASDWKTKQKYRREQPESQICHGPANPA
jgi:hypothetical protein